MAYVVPGSLKITKKEDYSTNITVQLSEHAENELLIICVEFDNNGSLSADDGTWTEEAEQLIGPGGSKGVMAVYWKVAGASETNPSFTFSGTARDSMAYCYTVRGAPTSSPIDGSASTTNDALSHNTDTFDTSEDKCLIMEFVCNRISLTAYVNALPGVNLDNIDNNGLHLTMQMGSWYQMEAGTTTSHEYFQVAGQAMTGSICIAIKDDGEITGAVDGVNECATIVHPMVGNAVQYATGSEGITDPTTFMPEFGEKRTITGATQDNPVVITYTGTQFAEDDDVWIDGVVGMVEINGQEFTAVNVTATTFELQGEDGTGHTAYTSGGTAAKATTYLSTTGNAREINGLFGKTSCGFNVTSSSFYDKPILAQRRLSTDKDLSGSIIGVSLYGDSRMPAPGIPGKTFGFGSGDNSGQNTGAKLWTLENFDSTVRSNEGISLFAIDISQGETQEYGSFDATDVKRIMFGQEVIQSSLDGWGFVYVYNTMNLIGGSSTIPCSFQDAANHVSTGALRTVRNQGGAARGQFFSIQDINIGDGSSETYFDAENQSLEFPSEYSDSTGEISINVPEGAYKFSINVGDGSTVKLNNVTINMGDDHQYVWESTTSTTSTTYEMVGHKIINGDPSLSDLGYSVGGVSFTNTKEVVKNDADLSGGCTIAGCKDTYAIRISGATQAALQSELNDIANMTLLSNDSALRIEYTGTGDITLNFDAMTWTSNTVDIHYNSTNSSTLTANMQNGSNASTSAVSGSAVAVVISNDVTFTININEAGAEITLLERGTQTEVFHVETASTSENYTYTYSTDLELDIQVYKPGFKGFWDDTQELKSTNQTLSVALEEEPASQVA